VKIGTKVRVERDEVKYPPKGTWRNYRGKTGTVTGTSHGEVGVVFCTDKSFTTDMRADAWFQRYELRERKK
jgi:hypothetical protein